MASGRSNLRVRVLNWKIVGVAQTINSLEGTSHVLSPLVGRPSSGAPEAGNSSVLEKTTFWRLVIQSIGVTQVQGMFELAKPTNRVHSTVESMFIYFPFHSQSFFVSRSPCLHLPVFTSLGFLGSSDLSVVSDGTHAACVLHGDPASSKL